MFGLAALSVIVGTPVFVMLIEDVLGEDFVSGGSVLMLSFTWVTSIAYSGFRLPRTRVVRCSGCGADERAYSKHQREVSNEKLDAKAEAEATVAERRTALQRRMRQRRSGRTSSD